MHPEILHLPARISRSVSFGLRVLPNRAFVSQTGPRVVFMPAYGRTGAARLRIYEIVENLRKAGRDVFILPWRFTLAQRRKWLASLAPDLVVMQGTRHPLNRPALYPGHEILLDLDDGDFHLPHLALSVCAAMGHVAGVMAGSAYIASWCRRAGAPQVDVVWTGAPVSRRARPPQDQRPPVVAWAQTRPMSYRHEADLLRQVMGQVARARPGTVLRLYDRRPGDDPGFADGFAAPGLRVEWQEQMGYERFLRSLDDVALGLAPLIPEDPFCRAKSFGKLLAYLDRHVPVVASDFGEPRTFFTPETGRLCTGGADWVAAITGLLENGTMRQRLAEAGFEAFQHRLSTPVSADHVWAVIERSAAPGQGAQKTG